MDGMIRIIGKKNQFFLIGVVLFVSVLFLLSLYYRSLTEINTITLVENEPVIQQSVAALGSLNKGYLKEWYDFDWDARQRVVIQEQNAANKTSYETIVMDFPTELRTISNCSREIRVMNQSGSEVLSHVFRDEYIRINQTSENVCINAHISFFLNLSKNERQVFYVYYGNSNASLPVFSYENDSESNLTLSDDGSANITGQVGHKFNITNTSNATTATPPFAFRVNGSYSSTADIPRLARFKLRNSTADYLENYVLKTTDSLIAHVFDNNSNTAAGLRNHGCGIELQFTDNTNMTDNDQDGFKPFNTNNNTNLSWYQRRFNLSSYAGKVVDAVRLVYNYTLNVNNSASLQFDCFFDHIRIESVPIKYDDPTKVEFKRDNLIVCPFLDTQFPLFCEYSLTNVSYGRNDRPWNDWWNNSWDNRSVLIIDPRYENWTVYYNVPSGANSRQVVCGLKPVAFREEVINSTTNLYRLSFSTNFAGCYVYLHTSANKEMLTRTDTPLNSRLGKTELVKANIQTTQRDIKGRYIAY